MSAFDQRGQKVNYQYNAAGNINFGNVQNISDLINELEKLKAEVSKAGEAKVIDAEIVTDVLYQIQKAVDQANKPEANKNIVVEYLSKAKDFVKGLVQVVEIEQGIIKAIELAQQLF